MIQDILFGAIASLLLYAIVDECAWWLHKRRIRRETWKRIQRVLDMDRPK